MSLFRKKELSTDYVELSVGRVDYKVLRWGVVESAFKKSTVIKDVINNAFFITEIENAIVDMSAAKRAQLSVEDGLKLRAKTNEILLRYGLLKETKPEQGERVVNSSDFSDDEQKELDRQYQQMQAKIQAMAQPRRTA